MLVGGLVSVIRLNDLIEERSEGVVRIVGSGIDTDSGISPLGAREDALLEGETEFVSSIFALFPNSGGKALGKEGLGSSGEVRKSVDVGGLSQVRSHHDSEIGRAHV